MPILVGGGNQDVTTQDVFLILQGELTPDAIRERRFQKARQRRLGYLQYLRQQELEKLPTRQLLNMLRANRLRTKVDYSVYTTELILRGYSREMAAQSEQRRIQAEEQAEIEWWAIRKVLAGRPHIRRDHEAAEHRRKLATSRRGQGKSKNR